MEQLEFFNIPNPCRGVCESNYRGCCKGCLRSREERLLWLRMSDTQKRYVLHLCRLRRIKLTQMSQQSKIQDEATVKTAWQQNDFDFN